MESVQRIRSPSDLKILLSRLGKCSGHAPWTPAFGGFRLVYTQRFQPWSLARFIRDQFPSLKIQSVEKGTLLGSIAGVRIGFFEFDYPFLTKIGTFHGISLASVEDLAAMKLSALAQRGAKRDFIDIFALLQKNVSLRQILNWYKKKFSVQDETHILASLVYFKDAGPEPMPKMIWKTTWREIKKALVSHVRAFSA